MSNPLYFGMIILACIAEIELICPQHVLLLISGETGDKRSLGQAYCNLAYAHSKTEEYDEAKVAFKNAIENCEECDDHVEACLATEGLAAIYFRENDFDNAINYYKEALAILTKSDQVNTKHSERIVNKLAEAVQYQLTVKEGIDGVDAKANGRLRHYGRRRNKPRYGKHNSLVAKGLEETNDELEEESSSADYTDSYDESDSPSERSSSEQNRNSIAEERLSDDGRKRSSKSTDQYFNRRRNYSNRSYNEMNGRNIVFQSGSDEEPTRRQRKKTIETGRVRNSTTCVVQ